MRPYIIHAPGYRANCGGVRCLHLLCHSLNEMGYTAMMHPQCEGTNPAWMQPIATANDVEHGITIYPEVIWGNPLHAKRVVRWMLGRTPHRFTDGYLWSFSPMIYPELPMLNIQCLDPDIFHPPEANAPRKGGYFWAGKSHPWGGKMRPDLNEGKREIHYHWPPNQRELGDLLRSAEILVSYDSLSGINNEAAICGCPVLLIANSGPFSREDIASGELGLNGIAWGESPDEWKRATATLPDAWPNYQRVLAGQRDRIEAFVKSTQERYP